MQIKKLFYDLETTGVDHRQNGIHQIAGCIEIDGEVVETFNWKVAPNPKAKIEDEALKVGGVTLEQIQAYPEMGLIFRKLKALLTRHCDPYNTKDKMYLVGYNNAHFDDSFLRSWFTQNKDSFFGSWFHAGSLDVMVLASQYLIERRAKMLNFKLMTVAKEVGIEVDEAKLHDAIYDIELTRAVYRLVTGIDFEL
jgi:DNA polymerase-3 subunit epsilon